MCHSCANNSSDGKCEEKEKDNEVKVVDESKEDNNSGKESVAQESSSGKSKWSVKPAMVALRKSARCKAKVKTNTQNKVHAVKGKSRRIVLKRNVTRAPTSYATPVTSQSLFMRGRYLQTGDIVSMIDIDGGIYYAQITGFLQDQYCEKSACVTWLLPSQDSKPHVFDPASYYLGPEEETPRKLECMEFVCHAPSDYYKSRSSPYPTLPDRVDKGFIWTRIGPKIVSRQELEQLDQ